MDSNDSSQGDPAKTLFIIKAKTDGLVKAENFLRDRSWIIHSTTQIRDALAQIASIRPQYILVCMDHPNHKVRMLPKLFEQAFNTKPIVFLDNASPSTIALINGMEYVLYPPVTGTAIERMISKIDRDKRRALEAAGQKTGIAKASLGTTDDSIVTIKGNVRKKENAAESERARQALQQLSLSENQKIGSGDGSVKGSTGATRLGGNDGGGGANTSGSFSQKGASSGEKSGTASPGSEAPLSDKELAELFASAAAKNTEAAQTEEKAQQNQNSPNSKDKAKVATPHSAKPPEFTDGPGSELNFDAAKNLKFKKPTTVARDSSGRTITPNSAHNPGSSTDSSTPAASNGQNGLTRKDANAGSNGASDKKDTKSSNSGTSDKKDAKANSGNTVPFNKVKTKTHLDPKGPLNADSPIVRNTQRALDHTVTDPIVPVEPFSDCMKFVCFLVRSTNYQGFVVCGMSRNEQPIKNFVDLFKTKLAEFMTEVREDFVAGEGTEIELQPVNFEKWAEKDSQFMKKFVHGDRECAIAYFAEKVEPPKLKATSHKDMMELELSGLYPDRNLHFDVYLHFPVNKKFVRYQKKGRRLTTKQKSRLEKNGVKVIHLQGDQSEAVLRYWFQAILDQKITEYKETTLPFDATKDRSRKAGSF